MIDFVGFMIVVTLVGLATPLSIAAALLWLAIGGYSIAKSHSRGLFADVCFIFSAPLYWVLEG